MAKRTKSPSKTPKPLPAATEPTSPSTIIIRSPQKDAKDTVKQRGGLPPPVSKDQQPLTKVRRISTNVDDALPRRTSTTVDESLPRRTSTNVDQMLPRRTSTTVDESLPMDPSLVFRNRESRTAIVLNRVASKCTNFVGDYHWNLQRIYDYMPVMTEHQVTLGMVRFSLHYVKI